MAFPVSLLSWASTAGRRAKECDDGSPISPVLFAIYIADVHAAVEDQVEGSRGISFVDEVTWLVEGQDVGEVVRRLE